MKNIFLTRKENREDKILLTKDKELLEEIGDPQKFVFSIEREVLELEDKGYTKLAIAKKLRITEEAVQFFIDRRKERIKEVTDMFSKIDEDYKKQEEQLKKFNKFFRTEWPWF